MHILRDFFEEIIQDDVQLESQYEIVDQYKLEDSRTLIKLIPIDLDDKNTVTDAIELSNGSILITIRDEPLTTKERKKLRKNQFAIPEERKYPIPDLPRARNALSRAGQSGDLELQQRIQRAVYKKFPQLDPKKKKKAKKKEK